MLAWSTIIIAGLLVIAAWIFLVFFAFSLFAGAPFVPTADRRLRVMMELAEVKSGTRVADLGSGDGKLLFKAARSGALCDGFEVNPLFAAWSRVRARRNGLGDRITIHTKNLWHADLAGYDVIFAYLMPELMGRLKEKVLRECAPGTIVISNGFLFPDWTPEAARDNVRRYRI